MNIKVIAFDVFGTVFDLASVPREEVKAYVAHIKAPEWQPLELPVSWFDLKAHPDAKEGLELLRRRYTIVTLSNGPIRLLTELTKRNDLSWDAIVPIEMARVYKPRLEAYWTVPKLFRCMPSEVLMVTANKTFGDIEAAHSLGMKAALIRDPDGCAKDIIDLAEKLLYGRLA